MKLFILAKILKPKLNLNFKRFLTNSNENTKSNPLDQILKLKSSDGNLALVSLSKNIHFNLALENYLAETTNLKNRSILLLWTSEPCIVFGRHQNPWLESNVKQSRLDSVKLARRYSGGGCVYHDEGNLNISFITDRLRYNRENNLNLIKNTLESLELKNIVFEISPRHDICIRIENEMFKISGTASRLAQKFSYHHCTLLFDLDLSNMKLLKSNLIENIITKATPSVRSKCLNLKKFSNDSSLNIDKLIEKLCSAYWRINGAHWCIEHLFAYINPEEENLAKLIEKNLSELKSWDYVFGTTPKFQLSIPLENQRNVSLYIVKGVIKDYEIIESKFGANELRTLKNGLDLIVNCRLENFNLVKCFKDNNLLSDSDLNIKRIFDFLNKKF
jgi:lipoyltransferase 1